MDEGIALCVAVELVLSVVSPGCGACPNGLGEAPVEALDHSVGLRSVWPRQLVRDVSACADAVEGVASGASRSGAPAGIAEAVGELGSITPSE